MSTYEELTLIVNVAMLVVAILVYAKITTPPTKLMVIFK